MDLTTLDGRAFGKFVAAGTYFLRKYRGVLNDLNVFPVPDGDTGSNMYLTARSALAEVAKARGRELSSVAAAAAEGSLLGARGNSGVILSQMLRGFAHSVRERREIDTIQLASALREAAVAARSALHKPVEGTMITVADAAAHAACAAALADRDFYRVASAVVQAAVDALDRTPEQLPVLKEAGVVDSGGAGIVYFLEGILRFAPDVAHETAYPRSPAHRRTFTRSQVVSQNKYCTEFVLEDATTDARALGALLEPLGDSLIVAGTAPTLKVHVHTADPGAVRAAARPHGRMTREKVDDMERQHNLLVVDAPAKTFSVLAVVPGEGFAQIARELGAEVALVAPVNPSVRELVIGVNACLAGRVYLLPNDPDVALAAAQAATLSERDVIVVPTRDMAAGLAVLLAPSTVDGDPPAPDELIAGAAATRSAALFFAGKDSSLGGIALKRGAPAASIAGKIVTAATLADVAVSAAAALGAAAGGSLALYYGGGQRNEDAASLAATLAAAYPEADVEYYFGGQPAKEYVMSIDQ